MEFTLQNMINEISEKTAEGISVSDLRSEFQEINRSYRDRDAKTDDYRLMDDEKARAYLLYRMPATASVILRILAEIREDLPDFDPKSILDIGAGPGVSALPLSILYGDLKELTFVEEMKPMAGLGKKILDDNLVLQGRTHWTGSGFMDIDRNRSYDLVLSSYMLNELDEREIDAFADLLSDVTDDIAVVIVPGTPAFFEKLMSFRKKVLALGFSILAPCTFTGGCHMEREDNWCHFSLRIQRTSVLRKIKEGELSYEDEKYSYLVISKNRTSKDGKRIIRHPLIRKGMTEVMTCSKDGIENTVVTKSKNSDLYKRLKRSGWGDRI